MENKIFYAFLIYGITQLACAQQVPMRMQMAGGLLDDFQDQQIIENSSEDIAQAVVATEEDQAKEQKLLDDFVKAHPTLKDPVILRNMYNTMRKMDDNIEEAHQKEFKKIEGNDPEILEKDKQRIKGQTPIRFDFRPDDLSEFGKQIDEHPEKALSAIVSNIKGMDVTEETIENQIKINEKLNTYIRDVHGMSAEEYIQLKQQEEKKKIPSFGKN